LSKYLIVFAVSALVTSLMTPLARRLALKVGAIDHPSDRKVHPRPTPTLGGTAIFCGILVALAVARLMPGFSGLYGNSSELWATLVAGSVVFAVGVYDDIKGSLPVAKLAGQVLAAGLLVLMGVQLLYVWFPGQGILSLSPDLSVPLTILWVLAMVNAVNLIDGLDGLAAGLVAIASIAFFLFIYKTPGLYGLASPAALISSVTAGAAFGFLPWNFNPAKIFMGDSGAMLLGLLLAVATISGVGRSAYPPSGGDVAAFSIPVLMPLLILAIPFLDVALAIIRRVKKGKPVSHADKEHIHHRLLDIGHSHRQAVLLMYLWSALISGCALAVAFINGRKTVGIIVSALLLIFAVTFVPRMLITKKNGNGSSP
jgi:UDP-GlcNAc:undecaprenyl-phosphate GlcNAc-1-phosphate transferase